MNQTCRQVNIGVDPLQKAAPAHPKPNCVRARNETLQSAELKWQESIVIV